jgi:soluble lytic murein transglycosylase
MHTRSVVLKIMVLMLILGAGLILAGCANAPPTPTPLAPMATEVAADMATSPSATDTTDPALQSAPTLAPTLPPTVTPNPSPTSTPTLPPTQTPTPSPTPEPSVQLKAGQRHQHNGDYEQAIAEYLGVLSDRPTEEQARQARYHLAETYSLSQDYVAAAAAWEDFFTNHPNDIRLPQATLMAARAHHAANECGRAVTLYETYLSSETVLADMVHEWIGDCRGQESDWEGAVLAYQQALAATEDRGVQVSLREKIAGIRLAQADYDAALAEYDAILGIARIVAYRVKIQFLMAQALAAAGRTEEAYAQYQRVMDQNPEGEYAYLSLVELVDAGVEVDEYQRGLIDYYAGTAYPDAYGAAIRAFERFLASEPAANVDSALYYKAAAYRALEQYGPALETLDALITGYPHSTWLPQAWLDKGATLSAIGESDEAVRVYQDLAAFFPEDELAPVALRRAARLREDGDAYDEAAELYQNLQIDFPGYENADEALWRSGFSLYRIGAADEAIQVWQSLVDKYPDSPYYAKTLYWLGKLAAQGGFSSDDSHWDKLLAEAPDGYYALRVEQIRAGDSLTVTRLITDAVEPPVWDETQVETEILDWLRGWTDVPTGTVHLSLPEAVTRRRDFRRGEALLAAGLRREALGEFDSLRESAWRNPLRLAQLSIYFREKGLYGLSARAASRLVGLWPEGTMDKAPVELQRLAYPLAYADLLSSEASARNLDPLLLAALIRQESLFEPLAESYAGARGLGQVMPATGTGIANSLGFEDFVLDDLYRPHVSILFGAFYLKVQMDRFDNQVLVALAAYNGGPGNTLRWIEEGGEDLDFFVEVITATQSRLYLQRVYEQYLIYERLYRSAEPVGP